MGAHREVEKMFRELHVRSGVVKFSHCPQRYESGYATAILGTKSEEMSKVSGQDAELF